METLKAAGVGTSCYKGEPGSFEMFCYVDYGS